jgi:phage gp36-like protein
MTAYATSTDLYAIGVPSAALVDVTAGAITIALEAASRFVDSYFRRRYTVPIAIISGDIVRAVCIIAAYDLMVARGYSPDSVDVELRNRFLDIIKWLESITDGSLTPVDAPVSDAVSPSYGIYVDAGDDLRGW